MQLDQAAKELYQKLQAEKRDITVGINEQTNSLVLNVYDNPETVTIRDFEGFLVEINNRVGQRKGIVLNVDDTFKL